MKIQREFSPEVVDALEKIDENQLKELLAESKGNLFSRKKTSKEELKKAFEELRKSNPFKDIQNPVEWQREIRRDRELPGR